MLEALILGSRVEGGVSAVLMFLEVRFSGALDERVLAGVSNIRLFDMRSRLRHRPVER